MKLPEIMWVRYMNGPKQRTYIGTRVKANTYALCVPGEIDKPRGKITIIKGKVVRRRSNGALHALVKTKRGIQLECWWGGRPPKQRYERNY